MTDYQPLIARAVEGLGKSSGEARRTLYERARTALVAQLRTVEPALSESEITRERLALEEAIRKVEAEAARKYRGDSRPDPRFNPRPLRRSIRPAAVETDPHAASQASADAAPDDSEPSSGEPTQAARFTPIESEPSLSKRAGDANATSARSRLLSARMPSLKQEAVKGFRDVVSGASDLGSAADRAVQYARDTRDHYEPRSQHAEDLRPPAGPAARYDSQLDMDTFRTSDEHFADLPSLEPDFDVEGELPAAPAAARLRPRRAGELEDDYEIKRPPRSYRGLIRLAVLLAVLGLAGAVLSWQWPNISDFVAQMRSKPPTQAEQAPAPEPKFGGRVPQEQSPAPAPNSNAPANQTAPAVAQRVVLYEEDPNDPQGKRYSGSAVWRTETISPGAGLAPELAVRADIEIPDRHTTVTWSLRRNTDPALPASHTIEIMFNLPADFPGGAISNVPGILMKQSEQARGTPLAGLAVKVTTGFFLIGLSAVAADQQRNVQLLKDQEWFDIPLVYTSGGRAILAVEKGPPGDRAFADAFAAWGK